MSEVERFSFNVSDVLIEVSCDHAPALRGLRAVWGRARPVLDPVLRVSGAIVREGEGGSVRLGEAEQRQEDPADLLPAFEGMLYAAIVGWHRAPRALLHAAAVAFGETVVVLPGESGAGKSSIALALVERGARYLTDELTVFDGQRLWGIPRAPQFDPVADRQRLPARLAAAETTSYRFRDYDGPAALPLVTLSPAQVAQSTYRTEGVVVVAPREVPEAGRDALEPLSPAAALAQLLSGRRSEVTTDLGPMLGRPSYRLLWHDPEAAAARVISALSLG